MVVYSVDGRQLAHYRVDGWYVGVPPLPGFEFHRGLAPAQGFGLLVEGAVLGGPWVADQDVFVELTPEQLVDPGCGVLLAAIELAVTDSQCGVQVLPG